MSPGYRSTEFWLACGVQIAAFVTALSSGDASAKITTGIAAAAVVLGYFWSRYKLKAAEAAKTAGTATTPSTV